MRMDAEGGGPDEGEGGEGPSGGGRLPPWPRRQRRQRRRTPENEQYYREHPWDDELLTLRERWNVLQRRPLTTEYDAYDAAGNEIRESIPPGRILAENYRWDKGLDTIFLLRKALSSIAEDVTSGWDDDLDDGEVVRLFGLVEAALTLLVEAEALFHPSRRREQMVEVAARADARDAKRRVEQARSRKQRERMLREEFGLSSQEPPAAEGKLGGTDGTG